MDAAGTPATATMASPEPSDDVKPTTEPDAAAKSATNALTPPASEEDNAPAKKEQDDSDLSDLDLDDDDDGEDIVPDHYWDNGKIPVFKPTMDQFRSFKKFVGKIDKYGMKSGIVKVIPPQEWRDSLPALDDYVKRIKIKNPITQEFNGTFGTYTQQNVEKQRSYNLPEWKALTEETQHQPPAKRGERRRNQEKVVRGGIAPRARTTRTADDDTTPTERRKPGRPRCNPILTASADSTDESKDGRISHAPVSSTPDSPVTKPLKRPRGRPKGGGQAKSVTSRRLNNIAEAADFVDEAAFKTFNYRMDALDEFTPERCAELEAHYWRSLGFNQPMYAADMPGSLFDDTTSSWNVAKLENLLDVLGTKVPGVNTAYLYMGMWKATFAWHLEDVDLYSINYIHFGAPKQWYSISQEDARKFESAMKTLWPVDAKNCDQFLRHKTYLISPDVLQKQFNVKVNKLVHYEGEFVITYPYGYHSGYNLGYNCAESVNFATESWLEYGRIARKCNCEADNVWVDVGEIERKLRGDPTPEYYEETDDDDDGLSDDEGALPSPPASVKGRPRGRKRKRDVKQEKPKKKRKIRIRIKGPTREPCVMCPNDNPWEVLLPTDNGKNAHRSCALYTPETWIDKEDAGNETICGVATIDRARLELKCNFCRSKRGACFQCSSKKCTRAFHATCAPAAGVQIDAGMVPTFGQDGTEYFEEGYDFRCRYHRPKMPKIVNIDALESSKRIANLAKDLKFNDVVQAQYVGQEVFAGLVVENRLGEMSVIVDVLPEGDRVEVEWKWLCVLDPVDSQRPKPSASAQPMPKGMNKKAVSVANRQDGVPTQDDVFYDNPDYRWHDFYNPHMPPPGYESAVITAPTKLKVDVNATDQLYFYLPTISTEAKCYFTDVVGGTDATGKAHFLDRVTIRPAQHHQHVAPRPTPAPARPSSSYPRLAPSADDARHNTAKPYIYKPKETIQPNGMWGVDPQALASQRNFLADGTRRSNDFNLPLLTSNGTQYNVHGSEPARRAPPARAFPREHYYSSETLPAAYPGEYSRFASAARRASQSSQSSEPYVPNYQSVSQQRTHIKNIAPVAPMMGGSPANVSSRPYCAAINPPSSSAHSGTSPHGAPLTPATTRSTMSKRPEVAPGFLESLQKYPYLKNSYLRRQETYESPYPIGGGFSAPYLPLTLQQSHNPTHNRQSTSAHSPSASISSAADMRRSQQWNPPSQTWHSASFAPQYTSPPLQHAATTPEHRAHQPTYQTAQEFQQSFAPPLPSTASREGAHARRLRDQGYGPYAPHTYANLLPRNSFGQAYDTAAMTQWQSPKAPTPSPLSDAAVSSGHGHYQHQQLSQQYQTLTSSGADSSWTLSKPDVAPMMGDYAERGYDGGGSGGYDATLPPMGGHETWRFT